jgi:hypothetical protein
LKAMLLWASSDGEQSYSIPVDPSINRLMFSGTFDKTGGSLTLVGPDGSAVQQGSGMEDTLLNCGRIVTVDAPASGTWRVRMVPSGRFWLVVHAKSDRSLDGAEFVERAAGTDDERLVRIQGQPIAGRPATLRVSVSDGIAAPTFQLVSVDAQPLRHVDLGPVGDGEFVGRITLPAEPFRVVVNGRDESGALVQRIWPFPFHGEDIEVVPPEADTVTAGRETPLPFIVRNYGPAVRLKLVASNDRGKVTVEPAVLELGSGAEGIATVRLAVPTDAPARMTISLTAASDATADGGYNSGRKTLTVVPE